MKICKSYNADKLRERDEMTILFVIIFFVIPLAIAAYLLIPL